MTDSPSAFSRLLFQKVFSGCLLVFIIPAISESLDLQQNKPLNYQNVADFLQKFNLKKSATQKALDTLVDSEKISFKEYGKQKIYLPRQDQMKEENAKLQEKLNEQRRAISEAEGGRGDQTRQWWIKLSGWRLQHSWVRQFQCSFGHIICRCRFPATYCSLFISRMIFALEVGLMQIGNLA